jgi:hypothetical protein
MRTPRRRTSPTAEAAEIEVPEEQVAAFRIARHHLDRRAPRGRLVEVVRRLVGVQSQVPSAAVLALVARVEGLAPSDVDDALLRARSIARTWSMRSTVHLVAREDHALLAAALGADVGGTRRWLAKTGLTEAIYAELRDAVLVALAAGPRTRAELRDEVARRLDGGAAFFSSWGGVLRRLALDGLVVFGPRRSQETTFVRVDAWWSEPARSHEPGAALAGLLRRYLAAFGPATLADFSYWSGLRVAQAKEALAALGAEVATVRVRGRPAPHVLLRADVAALARAPRPSTVRLLPSFDALLLGHRDKSLLFDREHYKAIFRAAGWVSPTLLLGERIAGTWDLRRRAGGLEVGVKPFDRLSRATWSAVRAEADALGATLGERASLRRG